MSYLVTKVLDLVMMVGSRIEKEQQADCRNS